jgi:DNA-binding NarL/FixJ family response regulator
MLKAGVRGCCRNDINPKLLEHVVMAIQQGELWIRRTLTCRLIDELGKTTSKNKAYRASIGLLNHLTQREYDIAVRVGNGDSNRQIAQSCAISERTVKAHLTEVYLKLGVTDRLNLALVLSADNRNGLANSDSPLSGSHAQPKQ